jgi:hypothetical protein
LEAEIVLEYNDARTAEAIAKAVSPDNFKTPAGLTVKTTLNSGEVSTKIVCKEKLATLIATIDDLLSCTSTAEKAVQTTRKLSTT